MSIGIKLNVESSEVRLAKQHLAGLADQLEDVHELRNLGEIDVGLDGIDRAKEALRDIGREVSRLSAISKEGQKHGVLDVEKFREATKLSKEMAENFKVFEAAMRSASDGRLDWLTTRRKQLEHTIDTDWRESVKKDARKELASVNREYDRLVKALDKLTRQAEALEKKGGIAGEAIGETALKGGLLAKYPVLGGLANIGKNGFGLLGLGSLLSAGGLLHHGVEAAEKFNLTSAPLEMRSGSEMPRRGRYGYSAEEGLSLGDRLNQQTGLSGKDLDHTTLIAQMFSRGRGLGDDAATNYMGDIYQSTRLDKDGYERQIRELTKAIKNLGVDGLTQTYLQQSATLIDMLSTTRGGSPINGKELSLANHLQANLWAEGVFGQGRSASSFLEKLQGAIVQGGNNPMEQMFFFNALGGAGSMEEYWELLKLRHQGLTGMKDGKSTMQWVMEYAEKQFGTDGSGDLSLYGQLALKNMFKLQPEAVEKLVKLRRKGAFNLDDIEGVSAGDDRALEYDAERYTHTRGGHDAETDRKMDDIKQMIGEDVAPTVHSIKGVVVDGAHATVRASKPVVRQFFENFNLDQPETRPTWGRLLGRPEEEPAKAPYLDDAGRIIYPEGIRIKIDLSDEAKRALVVEPGHGSPH